MEKLKLELMLRDAGGPTGSCTIDLDPTSVWILHHCTGAMDLPQQLAGAVDDALAKLTGGLCRVAHSRVIPTEIPFTPKNPGRKRNGARGSYKRRQGPEAIEGGE